MELNYFYFKKFKIKKFILEPMLIDQFNINHILLKFFINLILI